MSPEMQRIVRIAKRMKDAGISAEPKFRVGLGSFMLITRADGSVHELALECDTAPEGYIQAARFLDLPDD